MFFRSPNNRINIEPMNNQHIVYLDVIRIIACMMVIIMHAPIPGTGAEGHGPFLVLISYLTVPCVPLFFMVSGSLLLPCRKEVSAIDYLKKRIGKVVGPTVTFSLLYMIINNSKIGPYPFYLYLLVHKDMEYFGLCTHL